MRCRIDKAHVNPGPEQAPDPYFPDAWFFGFSMTLQAQVAAICF
jgi:hypothetical protein